jgi:hypothetical protein
MLLSPRYTGPMPYFDPAVAPMKMVDDIGSLSAAQALDLFVSSNAELAATVEALDEIGWPTLAESPLGAVPIRLLMSHALWDSWVHERDILLPLGMEPTVVADESSRARYVSALTQGFAFGAAMECRAEFGIEATDPDFHCVMAAGDAVTIRIEHPDDSMPVLRGPAVELTEALSTRRPLPAGAPPDWHRILGGLGVHVGSRHDSGAGEVTGGRVPRVALPRLPFTVAVWLSVGCCSTSMACW